MKTLAEKIRERHKTPYQIVAEKFNTSEIYVSKIARGERTPTRGKGLMILNELKQLTQNN